MASDTTFADFSGATVVFLLCACILYGALCAQAYEYLLAFPYDPLLLRAAAIAVLLIETLHIAITLHTIYHFTVSVADNPLTVLDPTWDAGAIRLVDTFVVLIVQIYYIRRLWILSKRCKALVVTLGVIVCGRCALEFVVAAFLWSPTTGNFAAFRSNPTSFVIYVCWLSLGTLGDVLISAAMCSYLLRRRTGFRSTDNVVWKVMAFSVNSGAITAAVAVTALVTFLVLGSRNIVNNGVLLFASGLYANSFFGMLNARLLFRRNMEAIDGRIFNELPLESGISVRELPSTQKF